MADSSRVRTVLWQRNTFDGFLSKDGLQNFVIAGQGNYMSPLMRLLDRYIYEGNTVIVFHSGNGALEREFNNRCQYHSVEVALDVGKNRLYEPLLGLTTEECVQVFSDMAEAAGQVIPTDFDRAVRAMVEILDYIPSTGETPDKSAKLCLTMLVKLAEIRDVEELMQKIMNLDCPVQKRIRLISDLGLVSQNGSGSFELIRKLIMQLAFEAERCGWARTDTRGSVSLLSAVRNKTCFAMRLDDLNLSLLRSYIGSELKLLSRDKFILIFDDIRLSEKTLREALSYGRSFRFGIVCKNLYGILEDNGDGLTNLSENIGRWIFTRHRTWPAAEMVSRLIGSEMVERVAKTITSEGLFDPTQKGKTFSQEADYSVRPESLQELNSDQAFLFDANINDVIYVK